MKLNITTVVVTIFAMFQIGGAQKAHATSSAAEGTDKTPFETNSHGCGCSCASCSVISEQSAQR